jgi:hypothetical protein
MSAVRVMPKIRILIFLGNIIIRKGNKKYKHISTLRDHVPPLIPRKNIDGYSA